MTPAFTISRETVTYSGKRSAAHCCPTRERYAPRLPPPSRTSNARRYHLGADVLDATWCTRWQRSGVAAGAVDCRQVLSGTDEELDIFSGVMSLMAGEYGFQAYVELVG